ncbi:aldehyde dehydrogenase (NADP(+)) [Pedobacter steynii]|nr:aldehyde dehydrogenase (NADP(+)) [Pedobacter steynii]NQX37294.1 aldehyde dehydrogenase (NADP(+)) [Pedobacter steynii]
MEQMNGTFYALNPATGKALEGEFLKSGLREADEALRAAEQAFQSYKNINKDVKAAFLRCIADEIAALGDTLINRAAEESGLPIGRLQGELGRTTGQLRLFAQLVEEGSWVDAIIDTAMPERQPLPRPDIRRMLVPLGPVVVFGASNFPLAFSVAGGDTASALASGCPVIVKAHPAHLGTSELVGSAIVNAIRKSGLPEGLFSLLYDDGYEIGAYLVTHPKTKAVTFTGSLKGGMALVSLAQQRKQPIPVFAEMGSINPVVLLPEAMAEKATELAAKCAASITLGAGQFCTNPGLLIAVQSEGLELFKQELSSIISATPSATMLTEGIFANYEKRAQEVLKAAEVSLLAESGLKNTDLQNQSIAKIAQVGAADFLKSDHLQEEIFGPYSLLVVAENTAQMEEVLDSLEGQLTVTLFAAENELSQYPELISKIEDKTGRMIRNGVPTGVEVCSAMQHGGPYPATNDSRFSSVGTTAIYRFVRPLAWQDWAPELLPDALKEGNPLGIYRLINQQRTNT